MKVKFAKGEVLDNGTIKEYFASKFFKKKWYKELENFHLKMKRNISVTIKAEK